jgi:hypothetical protein
VDELFRDNVTVNGRSERNLTVDWEYRAPRSGYPDLLIFRAKIEGDSIGDWNISGAEIFIKSQHVQTEPTPDARLMIFLEGIVVAIGVLIIIELYRWRRKKARS